MERIFYKAGYYYFFFYG